MASIPASRGGSRPSGLRGGRNRGGSAALSPASTGRGSIISTTSPRAASNSAGDSSTIPLAMTPARPQIPWQFVQQYQEFLLQLAWQEVRSGVTTTVTVQKDNLMSAFNRFVSLFISNSIPASNDCFPTCPDSLRLADRAAAIAMLNQSTSTGRASISKDSMYRRAKKGVKILLKYMGDWVRICRDPATRTGEFTPSAPPSGQDRDWVWNKIKSTEHRSIQCFKIYTSRSTNAHLEENTAAAIREALTHLNFARRGYSLEEEMLCRSRFEADELEDIEVAIYRQIMENVESGHVADADSDDDEGRTTVAAAAVAPRGYHEAPYCENAARYHIFEISFKAFSQYAGHGHQDISNFYTSEWADQQRTQASSGAVGRGQQRRQHAADLAANSENSQQPSRDAPYTHSISSSTASPVLQMNDLTRQMTLANIYTRSSQMLSNLEKAIETAIKLRKPQATIEDLQQRLFNRLMQDIARDDEAEHTPSVQLSTSSRLSRPRHFDPDQQEALRQIREIGDIVDNDGEGNCLFHVFEAIEDEYVDLCRCRPRNRNTFRELRAQVVSTLLSSSATVRIASVADVSDGARSEIFCEADMIRQQGSVQEYCDWLALDGSPGRSVFF
jgi:hypothetical protein